MKLLSKIIVGTTCVTIFAGTAYISAITLAPPPNYTVSNNDRLKRYDRLAVGNAYEKKTKSQEFYLGLSRWRRKMIKEEGVLQGRVLEIGAGCGGNLAYYPHDYFTDDSEIQKFLLEVMGTTKDGAPPAGNTDNNLGANYVSLILDHIKKLNRCDEIVLCDRSANMVESCSQKIQSRLGYTPYRYPEYDLEGIREYIKGHHNGRRGEAAGSAAIRKRKIVQEDGTFKEILATPVEESDEHSFLEGEGSTLAPILQEIAPGDKLPLLNKEGETDLRLRQMYINARQAFRQAMEHALESKETDLIEKRESRMGDVGFKDVGGRREDLKRRELRQNLKASKKSEGLPDIPHSLQGDAGRVAPQPLFSVANYAAEQLPFADNSFDTVVDMFGLCSYDDPVRALREMSRVCKPGGKLLLVEHGRGDTPRVNNHLDKWAPRHAKNWGCWWNRDIRRVVRLSGLTVEKWDNKHFGTSHYIVAKPYKSMAEWDQYHASHSSN